MEQQPQAPETAPYTPPPNEADLPGRNSPEIAQEEAPEERLGRHETRSAPAGGGFDLRADIEQLHQRLDALYARLVDTVPAAAPTIEPEMDIYENDYEFLIHAALPGVAPHDIRIEATAHTVTLNAQSRRAHPDAAEENSSASKRHRRSRYSGQEHYHFVYTLHAPITPEAVRVRMQHGMLEMHLPKLRTPPRPISIPVPTQEELPRTPSPTPQARISPPYELPSVSPLPVRAHEGAPTHKMGLAYVPSAGEDHTSKAESIGERSQGSMARVVPSARLASSQNDVPEESASGETGTGRERL